MLEERPLIQRSLIGAGAFLFVFTAAMAGSAFMITGGFGAGSDDPAEIAQTWEAWAAPEAQAAPVRYELDDFSDGPSAYAPPQGDVSPTAYIPPESEMGADNYYQPASETLDGERDDPASEVNTVRYNSTDDELNNVEEQLRAAQPDLYAGEAVDLSEESTPSNASYADAGKKGAY